MGDAIVPGLILSTVALVSLTSANALRPREFTAIILTTISSPFSRPKEFSVSLDLSSVQEVEDLDMQGYSLNP